MTRGNVVRQAMQSTMGSIEYPKCSALAGTEGAQFRMVSGLEVVHCLKPLARTGPREVSDKDKETEKNKVSAMRVCGRGLVQLAIRYADLLGEGNQTSKEQHNGILGTKPTIGSGRDRRCKISEGFTARSCPFFDTGGPAGPAGGKRQNKKNKKRGSVAEARMCGEASARQHHGI